MRLCFWVGIGGFPLESALEVDKLALRESLSLAVMMKVIVVMVILVKMILMVVILMLL
jgi:hypothetical protein